MATKIFCDNCSREIRNEDTGPRSSIERYDGQTIVRTRMRKLYDVTIVYQVYQGVGQEFAQLHKQKDICLECVSEALKLTSKMPPLVQELPEDDRGPY